MQNSQFSQDNQQVQDYQHGQDYQAGQDYPQPYTSNNIQTYSAYPETHQSLQGVVNYQGVVTGLSGWNDPPSFAHKETNQIIDQTENPVKLIIDTLSALLNTLKDANIQQKIFTDTEKRCSILFEKLQNNEIEIIVLGLLIHLVNALNSKDNNRAVQVCVEIMQKGSAGDSKWIVGVKRLVELFSKL